MNRRGRIIATGAVVAALVAPVAVDRDGFPFSTYPMYAYARGEHVALVTAQGITADGRTLPLGSAIVGQSDDPLIVAGELRQAVVDGRAPERCAAIAGRVARSDRYADAVAVEIASERHDVVARTSGEPSLLERTVHARCEVGR